MIREADVDRDGQINYEGQISTSYHYTYQPLTVRLTSIYFVEFVMMMAN